MSKPDFLRMARDMADEVTKRPGDGIAALAVMSEALREAYDAGLDRIAELEASNRDCVDTVAEWGAKAGALQAEVDAAEVYTKKLYRERDEAREAVKRLAGALEELATDAEYAMRSNDEAIARDALSDPIVKRIVEGG
jgi:hypothetical protein